MNKHAVFTVLIHLYLDNVTHQRHKHEKKYKVKVFKKKQYEKYKEVKVFNDT